MLIYAIVGLAFMAAGLGLVLYLVRTVQHREYIPFFAFLSVVGIATTAQQLVPEPAAPYLIIGVLSGTACFIMGFLISLLINRLRGAGTN